MRIQFRLCAFLTDQEQTSHGPTCSKDGFSDCCGVACGEKKPQQFLQFLMKSKRLLTKTGSGRTDGNLKHFVCCFRRRVSLRPPQRFHAAGGARKTELLFCALRRFLTKKTTHLPRQAPDTDQERIETEEISFCVCLP